VERITSFKGKYDFLSNFFNAPITPDWGLKNWTFPTSEHLFQASKVDPTWAYDWLPTVERIRLAATPSEAKRIGRNITLRSDWEEVKIDVMRYCIQIKFRTYSILGHWLIDTGDALLIEGNTWNDRFWGAVWDKDFGWSGHNWLGHLLMEEREALKNNERNNERYNRPV